MLFRKFYLSALSLTVFFSAKAQDKTINKLSLFNKTGIYVGTKIRVTPIPIKLVPNDGVYFFQITPFDQADGHLSGFGSFFVEEKIELSKSFSLLFHQSVRRDYLVEHFRLGDTYPYESLGVEKRFIYDIYTHLLYSIRKEKIGKIYLTCGLGYSGFNTKHNVTVRTYTTATEYSDSSFKRNFIYPAAFLGIRWEKKRIGGGLIFGDFLRRPNFLLSLNKDQKIILPEINLHYKLFDKKKY
jgi:hypothetical protein